MTDDSLTSLVHQGGGGEDEQGLKGGWRGLHIKTLVPIWIQCLLDDAGCVGLVRIHRDDCKRIRETKDFALG